MGEPVDNQVPELPRAGRGSPADSLDARHTAERRGSDRVLEGPDKTQALNGDTQLRPGWNRSRNATDADPATSSEGSPVELTRCRLAAALPGYELLDALHSGGQGIVYKARQSGTERLVAVKVLWENRLHSPQGRERFLRETRIAARLEHPNIVAVHEGGFAGSLPYYTMQFVDGVPIDDYVLLRDPPLRDIVRLFIRVCQAVAYAHQNGVIHRDLHPANILVDEAGEPHLLDFGLAKELTDMTDARISMPGQVMGALPFLSPEHVGGGDGRVDTRSDVYSLGVVLYLLLAEQFPYRVNDTYAVVREEIVGRPPLSLRRALGTCDPGRRIQARDVSRDLEAIVQRALAKAKSDRYPSVEALAADLENLLAGRAVAARAAHRAYMFRKTLRQYRWAASIAAGLIVVLGVSTIVTARALQNARAATRLACTQFGLALDTVEEEIRPLPGGVAVRSRLLDQLAAALPELSERAAADPELATLAVSLRERRGDISAAQGDAAEARIQFEAARQAALEELSRDPADADALARALRAGRKAAAVADDPRSAYEASLAVAQRHAAVVQPAATAQLELLDIRAQYASWLLITGQTEAALAQAGAAIELDTAAPDEARNDARWSQFVAQVLTVRGRGWNQLGQADAGRADLARALELRRQLWEARPSDTLARELLAAAGVHLADADQARGAYDSALALLREAAAHFELLYQLDPSVVKYASWVINARCDVAWLLMETGHTEEALAEDALAEHMAEAQCRRQSEAGAARYLLARCLRLRGLIHERAGALAEASVAYQRELDLRRELVAEAPDNLAERDALAASYQSLSNAARASGDVDCALEYGAAACEQFRHVLGQNPTSADCAVKYVGALITHAAAQIKAGAPHEAAAWASLDEADRILGDPAISFAGRQVFYENCQSALDINRRILERRRARADLRAADP